MQVIDLLRFFWDSVGFEIPPFTLLPTKNVISDLFWHPLIWWDMFWLWQVDIYIYKKVCYYLVNAIGGEWIGKNGKMPRRGTGKWSTLWMAYISNHFLKFYIHILITFKVDLLNKQSILSKGYIFKQIKPCRN